MQVVASFPPQKGGGGSIHKFTNGILNFRENERRRNGGFHDFLNVNLPIHEFEEKFSDFQEFTSYIISLHESQTKSCTQINEKRYNSTSATCGLSSSSCNLLHLILHQNNQKEHSGPHILLWFDFNNFSMLLFSILILDSFLILMDTWLIFIFDSWFLILDFRLNSE